MVQKGQFLERPTLIPVGDGVMEGVSHRGKLRPILLVLPPTPEEGGGMDHVLGAELAWAATRAGHPTLRFNYRGVGGSQGARSSGAALLEDARAALEVALDNAGGTAAVVASIGGSAGVALALAATEPAKLGGLVLVAPTGVTAAEVASTRLPCLTVVGELDTRFDRAGLARLLTSGESSLELIPAADAAYLRNLPELGKSAVRFLSRIGQQAGRID